MAGKEGYQRVMTVDDGVTWFPVEDGENSASEAGGKVGNVCESTVTLCSNIIDRENRAECLSSDQQFSVSEQKFNAQVQIFQDCYQKLSAEELYWIINDAASTEEQRVAAALVKQMREIKQGLIAPDKGDY